MRFSSQLLYLFFLKTGLFSEWHQRNTVNALRRHLARTETATCVHIQGRARCQATVRNWKWRTCTKGDYTFTISSSPCDYLNTHTPNVGCRHTNTQGQKNGYPSSRKDIYKYPISHARTNTEKDPVSKC